MILLAPLLIILLLFFPLPLSAEMQQRFMLGENKVGVAIPYPIERIELFDLNEPINRIILVNLGVGLTRLDKDGAVQLEAARSLSRSADELSWTFSLRYNLRFSDFREVTPADIKASFKFLQTQGQKLKLDNNVISRLLNIESIHTIDSPGYYHTKNKSKSVKFLLKEKDDDFPRLLSQIPIVNTELAKQFGEELGQGTLMSFLGPYDLRENRPDEGVLLEKANEFFRPGFPRASIVEFRTFDEADRALSALRVGAVDIIAIPTVGQLEEVAKDPTLIALDSPLNNLKASITQWNLKRAYWSEKESERNRFTTDKIIVRKSLKLDERFRSSFDLSGTFLP